MKAVIASPPIKDFYFTPSRASALGAESLRKVLQQNGIESVLFNFPVYKKKPAAQDLPSELSYLNEFIIPGEHGPLSFFSSYHRFGPSAKDCARIIAAESPQIVFITCFAWAYAAETLELTAAVKELLPEVQTAVGGAGVSVNPAWFKAAPEIDNVITGEAETAVPVFLENKLSMKTTTAKKAEQGAAVGFYWRETGLSTAKNTRYISAILSRGCPKACRFCSNHLVHGRKFRKAAFKDVVSGLNEIPNNHNIHFNFEDDNLLIDRDYFLSIVNAVKTRFPHASFSAENGLDYTLMDSNLVKMLISSGFRSFNFSMASSNIRLLEQEKREADLNKLKTIIESAAAAGAGSTTYFICGLEGDTPSSTIDNLKQLHSMSSLTGISMFYPVPGLPGFSPEMLAARPPRVSAGSSAYPWTKSLTTKQLITAFRLARFSNLIKTIEGRIPSISDKRPQSPDIDRLINLTRKTGRLHTLVNHRVVEVNSQDPDLVSAFLAAIHLSID